MDTICYLCRQRPQVQKETTDAYTITEHPLPDYRLLRVGLSEAFRDGTIGRGFSGGEQMHSGWFMRRKKERAYRKICEKLREELSPFLDPKGENYGVCCSAFSGRIRPQDILMLPEFNGYLDQNWVERLLPYAIYPHFIVLGNAPYLPELFRALSRKMKSLLWVLPDHYYTEMLEDFAEDFYQEYGLALDLRFLEADVTYGQARIALRRVEEPVNVLDFTENRGIPRLALPDGSVWLDLASVGEKEKKLLARGYHVTYLSLKKQWEEPQKALCLLDTAPKNRYNT